MVNAAFNLQHALPRCSRRVSLPIVIVPKGYQVHACGVRVEVAYSFRAQLAPTICNCGGWTGAAEFPHAYCSPLGNDPHMHDETSARPNMSVILRAGRCMLVEGARTQRCTASPDAPLRPHRRTTHNAVHTHRSLV